MNSHTMTDLEACAADHEATTYDLGNGFSAMLASDGGLMICNGAESPALRLTPHQTARLRDISRAAVKLANWPAVGRLCASIQAEIDGDAPIHSTDTQNALADVLAGRLD